MPIHLIFNGNKALDIVEGQAPYGISTCERVTKAILQRYKPVICKPNPITTALKYKRIYNEAEYQSMEKVAQEFGVSRVRIHQMLNLLKLDQRIIDYIVGITEARQNNYWTERRLRGIAQLPVTEQYCRFETILKKDILKIKNSNR
ncbi:MAG: hypothetical protein AB7S78_13680 [Candidatus Omnitrophota bacterium]